MSCRLESKTNTKQEFGTGWKPKRPARCPRTLQVLPERPKHRHSFIHSFLEIRYSGAEETRSYELDRAIPGPGLSEFGT